MCTSTVLTMDPPEKYSLQDEGWEEADRHKWNESEKAGYDLGEEAIRDWVRKYWNGFLRAKWLDHLYGRKFWIELDQVDFGILRRKFQDSRLLAPILDLLVNGGENLNVIDWAIDENHPMDEVHEILVALHVNSVRLEFQLENRLAERRHDSRSASA